MKVAVVVRSELYILSGVLKRSRAHECVQSLLLQQVYDDLLIWLSHPLFGLF